MNNHVSAQLVSLRMVVGLVLGTISLAGSAHAALVYDSGPALAEPNGANIGATYTDGFNLSISTPLGAAQIEVYSPTPVTEPLSVIYVIQAATDNTVLSSARVNLNLSPLGTSGGDSFYEASFGLSGSYTAGNYSLTLTNASGGFGPPASLFWQFCNNNGTVASLQLYSTSAVPEPSGFPWMAASTAILSVGVLALRKVKKSQPGA